MKSAYIPALLALTVRVGAEVKSGPMAGHTTPDSATIRSYDSPSRMLGFTGGKQNLTWLPAAS